MEAHPNVWLKPGYLEKVRETETLGPWVDDALQRMFEWSVSMNINPKLKKPGWYTYRLKRDHAATLRNQILQIKDRFNGR